MFENIFKIGKEKKIFISVYSRQKQTLNMCRERKVRQINYSLFVQWQNSDRFSIWRSLKIKLIIQPQINTMLCWNSSVSFLRFLWWKNFQGRLFINVELVIEYGVTLWVNQVKKIESICIVNLLNDFEATICANNFCCRIFRLKSTISVFFTMNQSEKVVQIIENVLCFSLWI